MNRFWIIYTKTMIVLACILVCIMSYQIMRLRDALDDLKQSVYELSKKMKEETDRALLEGEIRIDEAFEDNSDKTLELHLQELENTEELRKNVERLNSHRNH